MAQYRCYFLGSEGQLVGAETLHCDDDDEAVALARKSFADKVYARGFELLEGDRRITVLEITES